MQLYVVCPCGAKFFSQAASGRTRCKSCGQPNYIPAGVRLAAKAEPARLTWHPATGQLYRNPK